MALLSPYPTFAFAEELGVQPRAYESNATWTVTLAGALARLPGVEVDVVTEATHIRGDRVLEVGGVRVHFLRVPAHGKTLTFWQGDWWRLTRYLRGLGPDVVHGQGIENPYGYVAVRSGWPHVVTIHGIPRLARQSQHLPRLHREGIVEWLGGWTLRHVRNVVVINPYVRECLGLSEGRYRLFEIPNAIEERFFEAAAGERERDLLVATGYVDRRKGHDVLLRAVALLKRRGRRVRVVIVGPQNDARQLAACQELIRAESLAVEFTGFLPPAEVLPWMLRCAALVTPSRHETAPMVVAEAMACGTPVVASRVCGIPYMIEHERTGLLFEKGNASELADQLERLLEDPVWAGQLGAAARAVARVTYHPSVVAEKTRAAYEGILGEAADVRV